MNVTFDKGFVEKKIKKLWKRTEIYGWEKKATKNHCNFWDWVKITILNQNWQYSCATCDFEQKLQESFTTCDLEQKLPELCEMYDFEQKLQNSCIEYDFEQNLTKFLCSMWFEANID